MQLCNCGEPVKRGQLSNGCVAVYCARALKKDCKFRGLLKACQISSYPRPPRGDWPIIDLEGCVDRTTAEACFTARLINCDAPLTASLLQTLRGEALHGQAIISGERPRTQFLLKDYDKVLSVVQELHVGVQIAAIPDFFFKFFKRMQEKLQSHADAEEAMMTQSVDTSGLVYRKLKPYQQRGVDFIVAHGGRGLIADAMGLGKTAQSIAIAHHYQCEFPCLVITLRSLVFNWAHEYANFAEIAEENIYRFEKDAPVPSTASVVIAPYSMLHKLKAQVTTKNFQIGRAHV